ncbi:MAG: response regulator [Gammaproteobacteria bacterium]|nr:response regulator [Gammaproteobacteria bacterium]
MSEFLFAEEAPDNVTQPQPAEAQTPHQYWDILIVDDDAAVHNITKTVLRSKEIDGRKLRFHSVFSGYEATQLLKTQSDFAVILLDVVMESDQAGLDACRIIREELALNTVRIILRTGQPGSTPEEEVILKYRINDYKEKNELTASKLFCSIVTAVRSYQDLVSLEQSKIQLMIEKEAVEEINAEMAEVALQIEENVKALELSNRYKSQFLANMSHELRTPLNSILILSRLLADNDEANLEPDQIESAKIINNSGAELLALIEDILELSQLETGQLSVNYDNFYISDLTEVLKQEFSVLAHNKALEFNLTLKGDLPEMFRVDLQKVKQVLSNLIGNAIKFTNNGSVSLFMEYREHPRKSIVFKVVDTGIGIAEDQLEGIFKSFQQVDGSTSRQYGGTGLGLAISKEIVKLIQGTLTVTSQLDSGSTFTLTLPLKEFTLPNKTIQAQSTRVIDHPAMVGKEVLIVDDNPRNVFSLIQGLKPFNMKITVAENGQDALDKLNTNPTIDIVLMDIMMPIMDGNTAIKKIREQSNYAMLPVIAITAKASRADQLEAIDSGANNCMAKPVDINALTKLMASNLMAI